MSLLDARIPQLMASHSALAATAGLMRSTIGQAEQEAVSAQARFMSGSPRRRFRPPMPGSWKSRRG
jgi:mevalonate pyrophosphate decarboxylase